ncbi:uncharacterized protein LOC111364232, partial [Spodoptera litura]|uniref:Uncharacterized protein LOC111364232 n=1 Tax=Spodoptera litura TaxID=69820 RepID=A0A9J7J3Z0_SPOLT
MSDIDSFASASDDGSSICSFCSFGDTLGDFLQNQFSAKNNRLLNVCHINAQSVPSHYSDLYEAFNNSNVHAVLISETWLKPHLLSTTYPLAGYVLIRNDRINGRGGGVAIYLRGELAYRVISSSPQNCPAEYLLLEVCVQGVKIVIGVFYCPPSVDYFTEFESVLESLGSEYAHHVIMGDFNTNLLVHNSFRSCRLRHLIESACLHLLPLQPTHHNTVGEDSWLDLIVTSNPSLVSSHGQHEAPGFSHHDLIFLSYILKPPRVRPRVLFRRCFTRMDSEKLIEDASSIDWGPLMEAADVDTMVAVFNKTLTELYDRHAPVKKIKLKRPPAPWMTRHIQMAMRRRDRAFRKHKNDRTVENWAAYKNARNRCNQMVRNAKRRHILDNISSSSPADIWKFLGTLGIGKSQHTDLPNSVGLNDLNRHFSTVSKLDPLAKQQTLSFISALMRSSSLASFTFTPVQPEEIRKIILSIKSRAVGCDGISRYMVTTILDHLLPTITHMVNYSLYSKVFPSLWRKAYVRPLPKITNPTLPTHFRPISILPFLSKVLEACVHKQLADYIYSNSLISPLQSGFRPGHSTVTALLKVIGDVKAGMEDTRITVLVLVDFSNAFNMV